MRPPPGFAQADSLPIFSAMVESLDQEGRGVAHCDGKVVFIEDALPGEKVDYRAYKKKASYELARLAHIRRASAFRVEPRCPHFGVCGGCSLQHLEPTAQVAVKQRVLEDALRHIGKVSPNLILRPIHGLPWHYRQRARLSVRYVAKKGGVLVGFHERRSSFIADMGGCAILPARLSALIGPLRSLIGALSLRERIPQIEVAVGDAVVVLVLRILAPLAAEDEPLLRAFADEHGIQWWLQPGGPASAHAYYPEGMPELSYSLPEFGLVMPFRPTDFTQVNAAVNRVLVARAIALLDPQPQERIGDFFCGLGNFSLPMARRGAEVLGVEGSRELVARAQSNARRNGIVNASFVATNLFETTERSLADLGYFDKMLIDPPRDGAVELVKALPAGAPSRIIYVSCNPATLARDAAILVHTKGYRLMAAAVANMFPHTTHVESLAWFER
ncbi:MAG: 23S rRNA (uracil(1939)-C(5))-methyltransferase RlmD [Betaproteobacteria bacterium]|nr:23S rRNA (uracil(1939)-C(5))-methyltransferase RlmD [Betaproteobacteria bacterium]